MCIKTFVVVLAAVFLYGCSTVHQLHMRLCTQKSKAAAILQELYWSYFPPIKTNVLLRFYHAQWKQALIQRDFNSSKNARS